MQPNISRLEAVYDHSLIIIPYQGMYQEIHPCRASSIGSVKINTSLIMMRECAIQYNAVQWSAIQNTTVEFNAEQEEISARERNQPRPCLQI